MLFMMARGLQQPKLKPWCVRPTLLITLRPTLACCLWGAHHPKLHNSQYMSVRPTLLNTLSHTFVCCLWNAKPPKAHNSHLVSITLQILPWNAVSEVRDFGSKCYG